MKINKVVGTGGIGTGLVFQLQGDHTLGREESRLGYLTDYKDYCKQHIILHYVSVLTDNIEVYAVGKVGNDEQGDSLLMYMSSKGICTNYVEAVEKIEETKFPQIKIVLKYENHQPLIKNIKRVSKPGRRVYVSKNNIPTVLNSLGIAILSTSHGLMTNKEARRKGVGGEVLCEIW